MTERERVERAERPKRAAVLAQLRQHAFVLAREFELPLRSVGAERANVKRRYGVCYEDGSIKIRLFNVRTRRLLAYSSIIDTLCHELAHLRHFDHGRHFESLYRRILERARMLGIYRPGERVRKERSRPRPKSLAGDLWRSLEAEARVRAWPARRSGDVDRSRPAGEGDRDRKGADAARGERPSGVSGVAVQMSLF